MSLKRARSASPPTQTSQTCLQIYRSEPIVDRSSTFIGIYSPTSPVSTVTALEDIQSASHRMSAWRKPSKQRTLASASAGSGGQTLYDTGNDDDGEKYGGKKVEKALSDMDVQGSLVVARWYGGVMLGPVRFAHIEACAKGAIRAWLDGKMDGATASKVETGEPPAKKFMTPKELKVERTELVDLLGQRDRSIEVLRELLGEKVRKGKEKAEVEEVKQQTPKKVMDYSVMPIEALRKLERGRDSTIAFLLKQIDKVEKEQAGA